MTEKELFKAINHFQLHNEYFIILDYKQHLRNHKIQKICQAITQTTNLVQG